MGKLFRRLLITLTVLLVLLGGSWWVWRVWWSGEMLETAFYRSEYQAAKWLIAAGADTEQGLFALPYVTPTFAKQLFEDGMDPNRTFREPIILEYRSVDLKRSNISLLMLAVIYGRNQIIDALLNAGADVNAVCDNGDSALHYLRLADIPNFEGSEPRASAIALLRAGGNPHLKNSEGKTPLDIWPALAEIVADIEKEPEAERP